MCSPRLQPPGPMGICTSMGSGGVCAGGAGPNPAHSARRQLLLSRCCGAAGRGAGQGQAAAGQDRTGQDRRVLPRGVSACPGTWLRGALPAGDRPAGGGGRKAAGHAWQSRTGVRRLPRPPDARWGQGATFTEVFGVFPSKCAGGGAWVREFPEPPGPARAALQPRRRRDRALPTGRLRDLPPGSGGPHCIIISPLLCEP